MVLVVTLGEEGLVEAAVAVVLVVVVRKVGHKQVW